MKPHYSTLDDALRGSASLRGAMARRRWLAPLLVLCGVVGADDASAEIDALFGVSHAGTFATRVQALALLDRLSSPPPTLSSHRRCPSDAAGKHSRLGRRHLDMFCSHARWSSE